MVSSGSAGCLSTSPRKRHEDRQQSIQLVGFYLSGFLCLAVIVKLAMEGTGRGGGFCFPSCWDTASYKAVGFAWLFFLSRCRPGDEAITIWEDPPQRYEFTASAETRGEFSGPALYLGTLSNCSRTLTSQENVTRSAPFPPVSLGRGTVRRHNRVLTSDEEREYFSRRTDDRRRHRICMQSRIRRHPFLLRDFSAF